MILPIIVLGINALIIVIYFFVLRSAYGEMAYKHDILNKKVIDLPITRNCCSWWPLSHLIAFTIYSYIWPQHSWLLFFLGVLWEIIEVFINYLETSNGENVKHQTTRTNDDVEYAQWWSGSTKDIFFNLMGIGLGLLLTRIKFKN